MARYRVRDEASGVSIQLNEVGGRQAELLEEFGECQAGRCACPTDQYEKVASMDVHAGEDEIAIRLRAKPDARFDPEQIAACLDHTIAKVTADEARLPAVKTDDQRS